MAKELIFKLKDKEFSAAPVKLERKKLYGWTETVATDSNGATCVPAYLSMEDVLIIPSGGLKQAYVNKDGKWLDKSELTAYDETGENILPILPSAFDSPIELSIKATIDEFLDNDWESVDRIRMNPLLRFDEEKGWIIEGRTPGVSAINIVVMQERPDKKPNKTDVRVSQLSDLTPFEELEKEKNDLLESTLLERRVFKKVSGSKTMIHKFLLWKTNKEQSGCFPAFVAYHTDFSNGRKDMLKRDMLYTNEENHARELLDAEITSHIKKGWEEVLV